MVTHETEILTENGGFTVMSQGRTLIQGKTDACVSMGKRDNKHIIEMKKFKFLLFLVLLTVVSTNCKNMTKEKDTFGFLCTVTAPYEYPVQVLDGFFYHGDKAVKTIPAGGMILYSGWKEGSSYNERSGGKIPDSFGIEWFSFAENKFYGGLFDLPYDTIRKLINTPFKESLSKDDAYYNEVRIGMGPEGLVIVWLAGPATSVDIGRFQAHEIPPVDLNKFLPNTNRWYDWTDRAAAQKEYADLMINKDSTRVKNLKENGLSPGLYDSWRKKYNIRITPRFADTSAIVDQKAYTCISGESGVIALDDLKDTSFSPKAVFDYISVTWSFGEKVKYVEIKMDKKEIFDIYKRIYEDDPTREVEVRIDVNKENNHVRVFFCQLGLEYPREIEVEKANIKIYPLSEGQYHWITVFKDRYETKYPYNLKKTK